MTKFSIKMKNDEQILFLLPNKVFLYIHVLLLVLYLCHNENFKMFSFIFMFLQMFISYIHKYQNIYQLLFIHAVNVKFTLLCSQKTVMFCIENMFYVHEMFMHLSSCFCSIYLSEILELYTAVFTSQRLTLFSYMYYAFALKLIKLALNCIF